MDPSMEDQPIAVARANISKLHNAVQLLRRVYFLTSRGTREAAVVPVDLGELIQEVGGADSAAAILKRHINAAEAPSR
ncbi:prevent-host-death family protein [Streptomyces umbrinus]|uniref:prevent-host-death family protein n=1 Tax=Streptomyces umbrinus TaxID=67370 RepID=UPI003C2BEB8B